MKCYLMNKNVKVLSAEITKENKFTKIYEIININYAPLSIYHAYNAKYESLVNTLNNWFLGRGIPSWRKDLDILLTNLKINSPQELLNKSYALSLSDQYWLKSTEQEELQWENINFFTNAFQYKAYLKASFSTINEKVELHSPNNTTDGMLTKAWIIENNKRILVKGTYTQSRLEPINEWLASRICQILNIDHCDYQIEVIDNKLVSKCENFLTPNEEIITANDIFNLEKKDNNTSDYNHYINILSKNGIKDAKEKLSDMYLVDYLMMNIDRHMKNYGIIRNVDNLNWVKITPIFDTGESLCCDKSLNELNFNEGIYKLFTNTNTKFTNIVKYINIKRYQLNKLDSLPEELNLKLKEYNYILGMNEEYITKIVNGFKHRIDLLKSIEQK